MKLRHFLLSTVLGSSLAIALNPTRADAQVHPAARQFRGDGGGSRGGGGRGGGGRGGGGGGDASASDAASAVADPAASSAAASGADAAASDAAVSVAVTSAADASTSDAAASAASTAAAATGSSVANAAATDAASGGATGGGNGAGGKGGGSAGGGGGNNNAGGGDAQSSLTLLANQVQGNLAKDGGTADGQVPSLTSTNNFINFCDTVNLPLTNGEQVVGGSCNPTIMGTIVSQAQMPSCKFTNPANGDTIAADKTFTLTMAIRNLATGNFVNPQTNYFAAPAQVDGSGTLIGHSHAVIEEIDGLGSTTPSDPRNFAFFKGLNDAAKGGVLSAEVTGGLAAGTYKLCSINTAANHQPALVAVAQHASLDDCVYFTASAGGAAAGGGGGGGGKGNGADAAGGNATGGAADAAAASDAAAGAGGAVGGGNGGGGGQRRKLTVRRRAHR